MISIITSRGLSLYAIRVHHHRQDMGSDLGGSRLMVSFLRFGIMQSNCSNLQIVRHSSPSIVILINITLHTRTRKNRSLRPVVDR